MTPFIFRRPQARMDVFQIADDFANELDNLTAARRFLKSVEATYDLLADMPYLGRPQSFSGQEYGGLRSFQVKGFPKYVIFYKPLVGKRGIEVWRVLFGRRNLDEIFS